MNFLKHKVLGGLFVLVLLSSCSEYQKLLTSDDVSKKYKAAETYYNQGEFKKASRLFEQIIPKYRGKPQAERLVFFFADSYFQTKSYYLSALQYENFIKSYPKSERVQEAYFKAAKSYYLVSPKFSLDQEDTYTAIEKLQQFINTFPSSEYSNEANQLISELQTKLERKDFETSKQYFTIRDYKAAIKACNNFIASYPGTKFREEALFVKFESSYTIAVNSIDALKLERLKELSQQYDVIVRYYPESIFLEQLDKMIDFANKEIDNIENTKPLT